MSQNLEHLTTEQLEQAVMSGADITPEMLIAAREREEAAQRIAELKQQRQAELARQENEAKQKEEREAQAAESERRSAEHSARLNEIEQRLLDGEPLTCDDLVTVRWHLGEKIKFAKSELARFDSPEPDPFKAARERDEKVGKRKDAQSRLDHLSNLHGQACELLRTLPNDEKPEYLRDLKDKIAGLEQREQTLLKWRAGDQASFYTTHIKEWDGLQQELFKLRNELDGADRRDRSSEAALGNFRIGIKSLVQMWRKGEIALHEAELGVKRIINEIGGVAELGHLFWVQDSRWREKQKGSPLEFAVMPLNDSLNAVRNGASDFKKANENAYGFEWWPHLENAVRGVFREGVPEIEPKLGPWWTNKVVAKDSAGIGWGKR